MPTPTDNHPPPTPSLLPARHDTQPTTPSLLPARHGTREIGVYVTDQHGTRFVPAIDLTAVTLAALAAVAVVATGHAVRRRPAIGSVTMGPGGWVSLKRTTRPPLRAARSPRPWWAHLLKAHRLVVER